MSVLMHKPKTMVDIYRLLPEGTPIQVINNRFFMSPAPSFKHFTVSKNIFKKLDSFVEEQSIGQVCYAPIDVFLGDLNAVQPDIFFIAKENENIIKEDGIYGAPDIVIEVLSPKNKDADLVKKRLQYEKFGVKEYFVVEPSDGTVVFWYLADGKYSEQKKQTGKLVSKFLKKSFTF